MKLQAVRTNLPDRPAPDAHVAIVPAPRRRPAISGREAEAAAYRAAHRIENIDPDAFAGYASANIRRVRRIDLIASILLEEMKPCRATRR
jgi:hypothetical protein